MSPASDTAKKCKDWELSIGLRSVAINSDNKMSNFVGVVAVNI